MYDNPTAWIIPAHAGFTRSGPCARCRAGGSSPHTRGLRRPCRRPLPCRWIIPAHAGFTASSVPPGGSWPDHPRTRGVYSWAYAPAEPNWGSSPHTRGLRWRPAARTSRSRIIPAHAGFTGPSCSRAGWGTDHPRTRGVYGAAAGFRPGSGGSSPHTRGLPLLLHHVNRNRRIIPAHAGFTLVQEGDLLVGRDHPRTRGVYIPRASVHARGVGSSPHTRGLHANYCRESSTDRIIPAHAGFTGAFCLRFRGRGDHPRTRGVYPRFPVGPPWPHGSSPHTRGLRSWTPAGGSSAADHPRTRGVYAPWTMHKLRHRGSSPHTRGLPAPQPP